MELYPEKAILILKIHNPMKYSYFFVLIFICSCNTNEQNLEAIIQEYQNYESYDNEEYPLGNFSSEYFKSEKEFAENILLKLSKIDTDKLDENDNISYELLSFVLNDVIAYYLSLIHI